MGYNLIIGEFKRSHTDDPEDKCRVDAESVRLDEAPADGSPTDHTNERWPSYTAWAAFAEASGMRDLFLDQGMRGPRPELLPSHPGHAVLTESHALRFEAALSMLKARGDTDHVGRAEWLVFWARWALKNCKVPVLVNT